MSEVAFVFSGQGDQFPGMGKELYETYPAARAVYDLCDEVRPGTSDQSFYGTEEELRETKNTQPCLFAMELAAARVLMDKGVKPAAVAGFSLGEMTAAAVSEVFGQEDAFRLVCTRAQLMQREAEKFSTSMAAVVKLRPEQVEGLCAGFKAVYPVNYNCPGQITVSGLSEEMPAFMKNVKTIGGRAIPLKVNGAFHSPFMAEAAADFAAALEKTEIGECQTTLYSNITAAPYTEDVRGLLSGQICNPVKWEETVRNMIDRGIDTFVEIGPGKTLTNMIRKIDGQVKAVTLSEYLAEVEAC